jgi:methylmalonyl-CoA mutase N-terminal domain/subunit
VSCRPSPPTPPTSAPVPAPCSSEIAEASFRFQSEVEAGDRVIVGVNRFEDPDEREVDILKIDAELEQKQIDRVQALRARRDSAAAESALARLKRDAAEADTNLMPAIIDASRAYVTMGEMCDALRDVWGVWRETPVF